MEKPYGSAVTPEFLLKYFKPKVGEEELYSKNRTQEQIKRDLLFKAEQNYLRLRNRLNQKRQRSGKGILPDSDLVEIVEEYRANQQP